MTARRGDIHAEDQANPDLGVGQHGRGDRPDRRARVRAASEHLTGSRESGATPSTPSPNVASGSRNPFCPMRGRRGLSCTQTLPRDLWCWSCERWAPA
jgi:hypothetical protein